MIGWMIDGMPSGQSLQGSEGNFKRSLGGKFKAGLVLIAQLCVTLPSLPDLESLLEEN